MDEMTKAWYDAINAQQKENNAWSAEQAQKAMEYQTQMSNTAHQREIADLKAAGLNPVLSAGGSGATTGSGLAASSGNENVSALYGLAKQAIEANIKQAEAMENSAKYISGAGPNVNPVSFNGPDLSGIVGNVINSVHDVLDSTSDTFGDHLSDEDKFFEHLSDVTQDKLAYLLSIASHGILSKKDARATLDKVGVDKWAIYNTFNAVVRWRMSPSEVSALEANRLRLVEDNNKQMNSYYRSASSSRRNSRDVKN